MRWIATVGAVVAAGALASAPAQAARPAGCGGERSPCQVATVDYRGFEGVTFRLEAEYVHGCVVSHTPAGKDLDEADVDALWVALTRDVVRDNPCQGGGGGVRWRISWPKGPDGESAGSVVLRQWVNRSTRPVTNTVVCDDADGVRCTVKGGDEVVLTRQEARQRATLTAGW